jgi:beta-fructofuranosidase
MPNQSAAALRQQYQNDIHRPRYHFLPPANWMNDPNGFIQWGDQYHLFYQYNPDGAYHANMHWGHAASRDLVHWQDLPVALTPTPRGPDEGGCWSGCAVDHDGVPTIFYTSVTGDRAAIQTQSMATSADGLITWTKYPTNPVLSTVPAESGQTRDFRDPFVWREGDAWYMVLGSQIKGVGGVVFLYRSSNLVDWEYLNPLYSSDNPRYGQIWECPNFFRLGDKWVLIISAHTGYTVDTVYYFVGNYHNHRFTPEYSAVLDYDSLYAPLTCANSQGQRVLIGWLREARPVEVQRRSGWSGVQSIPRVLSLDEQNRLLMKPVPELETIRGAHYTLAPMPITETMTLPVSGLALDIAAEFAFAAGGSCGFSLACSADGTERIDIVYQADRHQLSVHKISPETNGAITTLSRKIIHPLAPGETLRLRILLDGSVVEVIANERTSLTSRFYPVSASSQQVRLSGAQATLKALDIWEMPSIWQ